MKERREKLIELLGDYPKAKNRTVQLIRKETKNNYILESLLLQLNEEESVPAYFAKPLKQDDPLPIVIFNHSHGGNFDQGKEELLVSSSYLQSPPFVEAITNLGYAVGSIDMWGFNERNGKAERVGHYGACGFLIILLSWIILWSEQMSIRTELRQLECQWVAS